MLMHLKILFLRTRFISTHLVLFPDSMDMQHNTMCSAPVSASSLPGRWGVPWSASPRLHHPISGEGDAHQGGESGTQETTTHQSNNTNHEAGG